MKSRRLPALLLLLLAIVCAWVFHGVAQSVNHRSASRAAAAAPQLPRHMMGADYPLNQPIADLPPDTRTLTTGVDAPAEPIAEAFRRQFGGNRIKFDTSMPITIVDTQKAPYLFAPVAITENWGSDDASSVPILAAKIEGGSDHHALIYDTATGIGHELFSVTSDHNITYSAAMYRRWDLLHGSTPGALGQNSADAAGLPMIPLLLRYDEAAGGSITHALRLTVQRTRGDRNGGFFTAPASHAAGNDLGSVAYEGMRLRLRPDFSGANLSRINQTIVKAFKTYGIVVADNGGSGYITGDQDPRWNEDDLRRLSTVLTLADFIPVNTGKIVDSEGVEAK